MKFSSTCALALLLSLSACSKDETPVSSSSNYPDMCIYGGSFHGSDGTSTANASITVTDGKITSRAIAEQARMDYKSQPNCSAYANSKTQIINLEGAHLYPGFVDAHAHLLGIGLREMTLNLEGTASIKTMQEELAKEVSKTAKGQNIYGRGWIETHWPENRFPTKEDLDLVSPNNPVLLQRADGHAMVANSLALKKAGITADTEAPFGGDILKGKDEQPTGMLIDNAMGLVSGQMPTLTLERKERAYIKASEIYAAYGWTAIHSMSVDPANVAIMEKLSDEGKLKIRVYNSIDMKGAESVYAGIEKSGPRINSNGRITTRAIKLYVDGALGSRGAALLAPYEDDANNSGLMMVEKETIMPILEQALRDGIQVNTHAIGDRANRLMLNWYEEAFKAVPVSERKVIEPRWRIEHSQIIDVNDIKRFKQLGVIPSMQPSHAIGDLHFAPDRLGVERLAGGYAWRSLIDSGVVIAGGSDAPVERGDPRIEYYAAISRKDMSGFSGDGWYPDEKVTRAEALKMFTSWAAYSAFEEDKAGDLSTGMNADFTIFDKDILTTPEAEILTVSTIMTIVAGEVVYKKE